MWKQKRTIICLPTFILNLQPDQRCLVIFYSDKYIVYKNSTILFSKGRMQNNTYSLRAILESDLDPTLCKLMLHEIKSPLLEHSFQLTTDDEHNGGSFSCIDDQQGNTAMSRGKHEWNGNRSQDIDRDRGFEQMHHRLNQMSVVVSQHQTSRRENNPASTKSNNTRQKFRHPSFKPSHQPSSPQHNIESSNQIVSPLQYNSNLPEVVKHAHQSIENKNTFILDDESIPPPSERFNPLAKNNYEGVGTWCGQVFALNAVYENINELTWDDNEAKSYTRKKIFGNKQRKVAAQKQNMTQRYVSFMQAVKRLHQINEEWLAKFIHFISKCLSLLSQLLPYRASLSERYSSMTSMLLHENPINFNTRETISNQNRIINRLGVHKLSDALAKICSRKLDSNFINLEQYGPPLDRRTEEEMNKLLLLYSEIQDVIEDYVGSKYAVQEIEQIYDLLFRHEVEILNAQEREQAPTPISQLKDRNLSEANAEFILTESQDRSASSRIKPVTATPATISLTASSLKLALSSLLSSLKINPAEYKDIAELTYIWPGLCSPTGYHPSTLSLYKKNKEKFINELCRNDVLIFQSRRQNELRKIERKLLNMGFRRNESHKQQQITK